MAISRYRVVERNQNLWYKLLRLEQSGLTVRQIAKFAKIPFHKAQRALASPYYTQWKEDKLNKRVSAFDREFAKDSKAQREELNALIPLALQTYEECMRAGLANPALLSVAKNAADSILDRSESLSKLTQMSVQHALIIPEADLERARAIARELKPIDSTSVLDVSSSVKLLPEVSDNKQDS